MLLTQTHSWLCRVLAALSSALLADNPGSSTTQQAQQGLALLLQHAGQLLSDMHREDASAVDALTAITAYFEAAEADDARLADPVHPHMSLLAPPGSEIGAVAELPAQPGDAQKLAALQPGADNGLFQNATGAPELGEVALEEKVAWLQDGQPGASAASADWQTMPCAAWMSAGCSRCGFVYTQASSHQPTSHVSCLCLHLAAERFSSANSHVHGSHLISQRFDRRSCK